MNSKTIIKQIRKNLSNIIIIGLLATFLFNTGARAWLIQQIITTGVVNAKIKNEPPKDLQGNAIFSYTDSIGTVSSTTSLKGKTVFINFWASWCPPCRGEMPSLNNLYLKLRQDSSIAFLFINEDTNPDKGKMYLRKNKFAIPFFSQAGDISDEIFDGTLPTSLVINKEGKMVLKHRGMAGYDTPAFIAQLRDLQ